MQKIKKIIARILSAILILVLIAGAGGFYYFKVHLPNNVAPLSFPQFDGEIQVEGLNASVDVYRDQMGIPHIYASTAHDLFFAQGYVHAQERFWQMDFWRHVGSAQLSEMFGESQFETDAFIRTMGWRTVAEAEWEALNEESKTNLYSFTAGVNAYLKDHKGTAASLEYAVLKLLTPDYEIEEWTPIHLLTWGKAMAWDLRGNLGEEIERAVLLKTLTPEQVSLLFPAYPADRPTIVNKIGEGQKTTSNVERLTFDYSSLPLDAVIQNTASLDAMLGEWNDGIGSNSWAISGEKTATGKPLLANDPHLGIQMPSIWFQMALHCAPKTDECPYDVAGFTFPGVPGIVIGHNDKISWGFTNVGPDVMDLFIEKINPENPNQYEVKGKWVDFETREEIIKIAGGETKTITVRISLHGPIISDTYGPLLNTPPANPADDFKPFKDRVGVELSKQYVLALSWTALTPSTPFAAIWGFNKAQNWDDFRQAARDFHVPAQNLLYADVEGNIGYQMPGDIPLRKKGDDTLPVPGWTDTYKWNGYIPFEELPYTFNPAEGYIATANNQVPPRDYPYFISADWDYGFRAQRIVNMIENAPAKIDIAYIQKMQGDNYDLNAEIYVPLLLDMKPASELTPALDTLKNWDYQASADSAPAAIFNAFWRHLLQNTFNDDMPEKRYYPDGGSRWNEVMLHLKDDPYNTFWDDITTTDIIESRDDILNKSFADGVAELQDTFGKDMTQWNWGEMHAATFKNGTLGESGVFLIEDLFNRGPFPVGGGEAIVNATGWSVKDGYETNWLPSMRMIVDLGNLDNSVTVHTTGESGHAYHKHYDDMSTLWANIQYYPMWWERDSVEKDSEGHLILVP